MRKRIVKNEKVIRKVELFRFAQNAFTSCPNVMEMVIRENENV
jgi:hypothetical protein